MTAVRKVYYAATEVCSDHKDLDFAVVADLVHFGCMVGSGTAMVLKMIAEVGLVDETKQELGSLMALDWTQDCLNHRMILDLMVCMKLVVVGQNNLHSSLDLRSNSHNCFDSATC